MYATASAVLADHAWHPWFLFFPLFWLIFLVVVFAVLRRTVWRRRAGWCGPIGPYGPGHHGPGALTVLGERYARGEIDEEEYRARRDVLTEPREDRRP
ncbi:SHOCT domain-containing protein [Kitasatospora sp. NPDC006697]|uniref:SHOCT domain-containing protein n=1 Tax=Kitasatospora sp. NPDC006697 TaxID=3364020 RepID=UPI0036AC0BEB